MLNLTKTIRNVKWDIFLWNMSIFKDLLMPILPGLDAADGVEKALLKSNWESFSIWRDGSAGWFFL
jgi:hypothetical protein